MVLPFMSCSARLPVYALMISTLFPQGEVSVLTKAAVMMGMYLIGTLSAFAFAALFKKTIFKSAPLPLLMELPPYRRPALATILHHMFDRAKAFLQRAGTIILGLSILLWFLTTYPKTDATEPSAQLSHSIAGQIGHWMEPALEPIGFNWKIGIGLIGAQAAREIFVSTLSVVYSVEAQEEDNSPLRDALLADHWPDGSPVFTPLVCITLMIFFVLSMQCVATLAIVKRETNTWRWPIFLFTYMTLYAYLASFIVYQTGRFFGL
jgi:ferrous iron transport protein B